MNNNTIVNKNLSFEKAFERLELILEKLNEGKVALDESLKLFEEANTLIKKCDAYLSSAQQKVETLIKNREGSLETDENKLPQMKEFAPNQANIFQAPSDEVPF